MAIDHERIQSRVHELLQGEGDLSKYPIRRVTLHLTWYVIEKAPLKGQA